MSSKIIVNTIVPRTNPALDFGGLSVPTYNGDPLSTSAETSAAIAEAIAVVNPILSYSNNTPFTGSSDVSGGMCLKWGRIFVNNSSGTHTTVVTFPQGFSGPLFSIQLSAQTGALILDSLNYAVYNPSSTGFTLVVVRSGTASATTYINWVAYGKN